MSLKILTTYILLIPFKDYDWMDRRPPVYEGADGRLYSDPREALRSEDRFY